MRLTPTNANTGTHLRIFITINMPSIKSGINNVGLAAHQLNVYRPVILSTAAPNAAGFMKCCFLYAKRYFEAIPIATAVTNGQVAKIFSSGSARKKSMSAVMMADS